MGLRSVAAPLRDSQGRAIAAINVSTHAGRTTMDEVHEQLPPGRCSTPPARSARRCAKR